MPANTRPATKPRKAPPVVTVETTETYTVTEEKMNSERFASLFPVGIEKESLQMATLFGIGVIFQVYGDGNMEALHIMIIPSGPPSKTRTVRSYWANNEAGRADVVREGMAWVTADVVNSTLAECGIIEYQ